MLRVDYLHNNFVSAAYTMAKYGMSMCVLGMAEEFKEDGIAVNALWPRTGKVHMQQNVTFHKEHTTFNILFILHLAQPSVLQLWICWQGM